MDLQPVWFLWGGEWHQDQLALMLKYAQEKGYKTCLYSGQDEVDKNILQYLTFVKTGPWIQELGGLESKTTNQLFTEVKTNNTLNHLFISN